jgi:CDP-diacylglycerol--glycerol-3-phosphate 3-phosphatidyltransferase
MSEVGAITVGERPTRVIIVTMALLATAARPDEVWPSLGAAGLVGVGLIGFGQLLLVVRRRLAGPA